MHDSGGPPHDETPIFSSRRRQRGGTNDVMSVIGLVAGGLIVAIGLVWWFFGRSPEVTVTGTPLVTDSTPAVSTPTPRPAIAQPEPEPDLPELSESDPFVRDRLSSLSSDPVWLDWLGVDDLVGRAVTAVANIGVGASPAEQLPFMQPSDTFTVIQEGERTFVDPASYRRYDAVTSVIASVDVGMAATVYRRLGPLFEAAWRPLGFGEADFDTGLARALGVILSVPVQEGPIELQPSGIIWEYVDPQLESLSAAQKHLLRIGPANARRLQGRARGLATALGIEPIPPQ